MLGPVMEVSSLGDSSQMHSAHPSHLQRSRPEGVCVCGGGGGGILI